MTENVEDWLAKLVGPLSAGELRRLRIGRMVAAVEHYVERHRAHPGAPTVARLILEVLDLATLRDPSLGPDGPTAGNLVQHLTLALEAVVAIAEQGAEPRTEERRALDLGVELALALIELCPEVAAIFDGRRTGDCGGWR